jgi:hypothetical protein
VPPPTRKRGASQISPPAAAANKRARHDARTSRYALLDAASGAYEAVPGARPGNQNSRRVVRKTAGLIEATVPRAQQRDTTLAFIAGAKAGHGLSKMNSGKGLHMAHGRSVDELKKTMVAVLNEVSAADPARRDRAASAFVEFTTGYVSSDAEDADAEDVRANARRMVAARATPAARLAPFDRILRRLNRVSRNLAGGDPATNSGLGNAQDLATRRDHQVFRHMLRRSKMLDRLQKTLGMKPERILRDATGRAVTSTLDHP